MNSVDHTEKSPLTCISIGPGIRGIERGIEYTGTRLNHLAYVEIEAFIIENLVAEMEACILDTAVIWSDAKTFPAHLFRGKVNLLLAGYPCQPFSNAGQRKGTEDARHLYPHIESTIDIIRPDICFFENVRGHVTLGLREVIASLEGMGYRVHWGIFSAEETGASHKRERVFIMAVRKDLMEDTDSKSNRNNERGIYRETAPASFELGDSTGDNERRQWQSEQSRSESLGRSSNQIMGNPNNQGLQGWISGVGEECTRERITGANGPFAPVSRPGQPQQAWEHPRVISREVESSVGLSANGYRFREDILRALGNSVYASTAELAFKTLLTKHKLTL